MVCATVGPDGEVAGYTMIAIHGDVTSAGWQWATIVLPTHRGSG